MEGGGDNGGNPECEHGNSHLSTTPVVFRENTVVLHFKDPIPYTAPQVFV